MTVQRIYFRQKFEVFSMRQPLTYENDLSEFLVIFFFARFIWQRENIIKILNMLLPAKITNMNLFLWHHSVCASCKGTQTPKRNVLLTRMCVGVLQNVQQNKKNNAKSFFSISFCVFDEWTLATKASTIKKQTALKIWICKSENVRFHHAKCGKHHCLQLEWISFNFYYAHKFF